MVHQAVAIMYCTQKVIQGENFCDRLKNRKNYKSFPTRKFCCVRYSDEIWDEYNIYSVYRKFTATHTITYTNCTVELIINYISNEHVSDNADII